MWSYFSEFKNKLKTFGNIHCTCVVCRQKCFKLFVFVFTIFYSIFMSKLYIALIFCILYIKNTFHNLNQINYVSEIILDLQNSWFLLVFNYKEFLIQSKINGTIRNGCKFDSTGHTWILLVNICRCTTKTLVAFKSQHFSYCAIVLSRKIYCWKTHSRNLLLSNNQLGIPDVVQSRSQKCREILHMKEQLIMI